MMTSKQIQIVKRNLLAAQISYRRSELNEESLYVELHNFFQRLKTQVLKEFEEYWNDDFMLQAQADLILAPLHEAQREYAEILQKHIEKEFYTGKATAKRYVALAQKKAKRESRIKAANKAQTKVPINGILKRERELFGTSEHAGQKLANQSFTASEKTMARIDNSINKILTDGYKEGWGQNKVAADLEKRFEQLKTWEARRIARTEIHNAHNEGINQTYVDMNVSYTQWGATQDDRTRGLKPSDSADHVSLDGEIIPFGGTYSNGLAYPGDTSGPIEEWINCRCVNLPFIIPDGYIAPPFSPFREEDLVPTLDVWNQDELIEQATEQLEDAMYPPRFDETRFNELKTHEEIADFFGLEYNPNGAEYKQINAKSIEFYDRKNDVTIRVFHDEQNKMPSLDLTNSGKGKANLKDIIRAYDDAPTAFKRATDDIQFAKGDQYSPCGHCADHSIQIYENALDYHNKVAKTRRLGEYGKYTSIEATIWHEMAHAFDAAFVDYVNGEYVRVDVVSQELLEKWEKATKEDHKFQRENGMMEQESTDYGAERMAEDFAEFGAMVVAEMLGKGSEIMHNAYTIKVPFEDSISGTARRSQKIIESLNANPHRWELMKELIETNENISMENKLLVRKRMEEFRKQEAEYENRYGRQSVKLDKYALSEEEQIIYEELKAKNEKEGKLKFRDRHKFNELADRMEFNEMWNQILREGGDPHDYFAHSVRYEKLYKQFKDWVPKGEITITEIKVESTGLFENTAAFKLTRDEKTVYKQLKENSSSLSPEEKAYRRELQDKIDLNRLHDQLIKEGLDDYDSAKYVQLYSQYKGKWGLPELSIDLNFSTPTPSWKSDSTEVTIGDKYALSKKETLELENLQKKKLFSENGVELEFTSKELKRLEELQNREKFNYLYYLRKGEGGLSYAYEQDFKELYSQFKRKLKLPKSILNPELPKYTKPHIEPSNETPLRLRGTTEDGSLPGGRNVLDLFTIDVTKCTPREQQVTVRWLGNDYSLFRDVTVRAKGDLNKYIDYVLNEGLDNNRYLFIKEAIENGRREEAIRMIKETYEDIQHDLPVITNLLENNCVKVNMKFFRVEERLHLGENPKKGDRVTFEGMNSVAVTKQGAEHFAEVSHRDFEWLLEIEAPAGTTGAYVATLNQAEKFAREMEFLLSKDTEMEIVSISNANKTVKLKIIVEEEANKSMIRTIFEMIKGVVS